MNRSPWFLVSEPKTYCRHHSRAYRYEHSTLPHPGPSPLREEDTQAEEKSSFFVYSVYPSPSSLRPRLGGSWEKPGRVQGQRVQLAQSGRVSSWPQICPHPRRPLQLLPSQSTGKDDTGPQARVGGRCRLQGEGRDGLELTQTRQPASPPRKQAHLPFCKVNDSWRIKYLTFCWVLLCVLFGGFEVWVH